MQVTLTMPWLAAIVGALVLMAVVLAYLIVFHKGPPPIEQVTAAAAHKVAIDAVAARDAAVRVWRKAVADEIADAKEADVKAQQNAAALAAFESGTVAVPTAMILAAAGT